MIKYSITSHTKIIIDLDVQCLIMYTKDNAYQFVGVTYEMLENIDSAVSQLIEAYDSLLLTKEKLGLSTEKFSILTQAEFKRLMEVNGFELVGKVQRTNSSQVFNSYQQSTDPRDMEL